MSAQPTLFDGVRLQMSESIRLTTESLAAYGALHKHWAVAFSGGKDSTALVTLVMWMIESGKVPAPESLTVLYADTRLELLPLWLSARTILDELRDRGVDVRVVMAPIARRFLPYILGRGVPPSNNGTMRWCTRQIKVDPMRAELERLRGAHPDVLMLTGVRLGESAVRDARINLSCSKGDGECGQGWYQRDATDRGHATLAPILHWRVCHVWEWLKHWAPKPEFGDWTTELLADVYGGDEAEELAARTGCVGCPLTDKDTALDRLLRRPMWSYLAPLKRLRPLWREARSPLVRLRQPSGEKRRDGTLSANQNRMGPLVMDERLRLLDAVLAIQAEINVAAIAQGRPLVDLLDADEVAFIRAAIASDTWPEGWTGKEPGAWEWFEEHGQASLFGGDVGDVEADGETFGLEES